MFDYIICMDASGDIPEDIAKNNQIEFVPMEYTLGEETRTSHGCEGNELLKRFYDGQRTGDLTQTSQISPYMYEEYFRTVLKNGKSILYFCLSGGLSSTYSSSVTAARNLKEEFPHLTVLPVDTLAATGGIGLLAEKAIANRKQGMTITENYDAVCALIPKLRHFFLVQDLMYLKRGGRIGAATAYVGSMLNIRPLLKIDENGKLITIGKKRGNKSAMAALYDLFAEHYNPALGGELYICDSDAPLLADALVEKLMAEYPRLQIRRTMLSPIIGAHTGPGMLSIIFFGK